MPKRPEGQEATVNWKLRIPASLAAKVEILLTDPRTRKPRYGERSTLVASLLQKHLREINFSLSHETERLYSTPTAGEGGGEKQ